MIRARRPPFLFCLSLLLLAGCSGDRDLGADIYRQGIGADGPLSYTQGPGWLPRVQTGCVMCHGADGRGRVVRAGTVTGAAPPINWQALVDRGYDAASLDRAIRDGVDVRGRTLHYYMPRWAVSDRELQALRHYLAGL